MKLCLAYLLTLAVSVSVSGCATSVLDEYCLIEKPYRPTAAEFAVMSPDNEKQVLSHNEYGATRCGWKP
jgi:hypothetical protein